MSTEPTIVAEADQQDVHRKHLEKRALKGTSYVVVAYGLSAGLRLLSSIVLTRLFAPAYFGLMALVSTILIGLNLLSHLGLEDSIIQNPRGEEREFLLTAWTLQVIRGAGLWLVAIPIAFPLAIFYHEHLMIPVLPLLGLGCFIASLTSPSLLLLARHMGVGRISFLELLTATVQFIATAIWALIHADIWALVGGRLIGEVLRTVVSYRLGPSVRPRLMMEPAAVRSLIHFGRWVLFSTALTFFAMQSDRLMLGKLISWQLLGIYGIAYTLSDVPRQVIIQFSSRVGYPFIARFSHLPRIEYLAVYRKYRRYVLALGALALTCVIAGGDQFILHVYDKRYHQAAWMVVILGCGLWHTLMTNTMTPALFSIQKPHYHTIAMVCYCATLFIFLPLGFHWFGMLGAVVAVAISDLPVYLVSTFALIREDLPVWRQDIQITLLFLAMLAAALILRHAVGLESPFRTLP